MASWIQTLNDPILVVRFQRLCGLKPKPRKQNGTPLSDSTSSNGEQVGNDKHSKTNGNVIANGSIRSRTAHKNTEAVSSASGSDSDNVEDTDTDYVATNKFLHYLFHFGAEMGNELFYITFFPNWLWNVDGYVGRRVCMFWSIFMYLGQASKDIIRWPRPAAPPVFRLEKRYALEYGLPSTHAMVGAGIPFSLLYLTMQRYIYPFEYGVIGAIIWCTLVTLSRLYLGMHSVLDVLAGLLFVFILMPVLFPWLDVMDDFVLHSSYSPLVCIFLPLALALCYPTLDRWSTARGDTTLILAISGGLGLAHWFSFQYGFMEKAPTPPPYPIIPPSFPWLGEVCMRLVIGVVILMSTRAVTKAIVYRAACYFAGASRSDARAHQRLAVELPYKFVTYMVVAFTCIYVAPQVFRILGIERATYFTEL